MSTELHQGASQFPVPKIDNFRVALAVAEWNSHITDTLAQGAIDYFKAYGIDVEEDVDVYHVPGTVELTFAASQLIESSCYDAVIVIGCVIRGDTPHFDYVCQGVTQGVAELNARGDAPVIFGVLTVNKLEEAQARAGGKLGNKGAEAAAAALQMSNLHASHLNN